MSISPFGPIFGKELRVASRRKRNHLLRVVYLGLLLLILLMIYVNSRPSLYYRGSAPNVAYRVQMQAQLGQIFFASFSIFSIIVMGLVGPVLTCAAINSERLGKTLPVLLMTPITSWQIVAGKLLSRLLTALVLLGLSLPVLAIVRLLGGVEVHQMLAVIALCVTFALWSASVGLFWSTLVNRVYAAILLSYATLFALYFLAPLFSALLLNAAPPTFGPSDAEFMMLLTAACNPVFNVAMLVIPESSMIVRGDLSTWLPGVGVHLGATVVVLMICAFLVRRQARREGGVSPAPAEPLSNTPPPPLPHELGAARVTSERAVSDNPVLWRETRSPLMRRRWAALGVVLVLAVLLISYGCFAATRSLGDSDLQIGYAWVFNGLWWLVIAVLSATAIAQEKESDTWTLLLATPLGARQIVLGKLLGVARRMALPTIILVTHFSLFAMAGVISTQTYFVILWVTLTFNSVWAASGIALSIRFQKVTTAVIVNLALPVFFYIVLPVLVEILGSLQRNRSHWIVPTALYIPYSYTLTAMETNSPAWGRYAGVNPRGIWFAGQSITLSGFIGLTIAMGCAHLLVTWGLITWTIRHFNRLVGRATQLTS